MGLDENTIRCSFPVCDFSLTELINLILYLNGSNFEGEEEKKNECQSYPVPSKSHVTLPAHPMPRSSTCWATDHGHPYPSKIFCGHKWGPNSANLGAKLADPAITSVQSALKCAAHPLKPVSLTSGPQVIKHPTTLNTEHPSMPVTKPESPAKMAVKVESLTEMVTKPESPTMVSATVCSAKSHYFILRMDTVTADIQRPHPWTLLYADDVAPADSERENLEDQVQKLHDHK
ncbi:reverse transcriptase [Labeo rohita]|uniref:Reverse transcriptase n=1 Tax=Labeo rohita TaxID=84645 RepID=A0A498LZE7_LABRO|nr:reverse transcriptase [Labeo rohita]